MLSPLRSLSAAMSCLLALTSLTLISHAQNVTTWHNDNNRTGWQQNETILTPSVVQTNFGLLWQWPVKGQVRAQPLAVTLPQSVGTCNNPCSLVFIATEQDMLYAFNAASNSQTPVWSLDLGQAGGGTAVDCAYLQTINVYFGPCDPAAPPIGGYVGITGTPVIDTIVTPDILFVVGVVQIPTSPLPTFAYDVFAVNITSGTVLAQAPIAGSVNGKQPVDSNHRCTSTYPAQGQRTFDPTVHLQRPGLLLLGSTVYVGFAPFPEFNNGWLFAYSYTGTSFSQTAAFNSTPYGSGGGIWQSGAGPASDGTSIFAATGNGTTFDVITGKPIDVGDSLLKLDPSTLAILDYYTPSDVFTFPPIPPKTTPGRCFNDIDLASGGILLIPDVFYNGRNLVVNADKESKLYVADKASLGQFNPNGGNNIQVIQSPLPLRDSGQGYWASPAYWKYTTGSATTYMLYYSATDQNNTVQPLPINGYQLLTGGSSGPIPSQYTSTSTLFCYHSPTPSVSSNGTMSGSGIVWAIEDQNASNPTSCRGAFPGPAALHAFNATNLQQELYSSRGITTAITVGFATPTIFQGRVYMGTHTEVDVFGLLH